MADVELSDAGGGHYAGTLALTEVDALLVQAVDWAGNVASVQVTGNDEAGGAYMGRRTTFPRVFSILLPDVDEDGVPDAYEELHPASATAWQPIPTMTT